jgi:hypothetical protein
VMVAPVSSSGLPRHRSGDPPHPLGRLGPATVLPSGDPCCVQEGEPASDAPDRDLSARPAPAPRLGERARAAIPVRRLSPRTEGASIARTAPFRMFPGRRDLATLAPEDVAGFAFRPSFAPRLLEDAGNARAFGTYPATGTSPRP